MKFEKFTVKDIIFIAVLSAALTLCGLITMPLVMNIDIFALRNLASAILYSLFCMLGIMKVRKMGTLTLIGLLCGFVVLMMTPVMFWSLFLGALACEIVTFIIFRNYSSDNAKLFAATMYIPFTFPGNLVFAMLIHGKSAGEVYNTPVLSSFLIIATVLLSYIGAKMGQKIGKELQKAGKLS